MPGVEIICLKNDFTVKTVVFFSSVSNFDGLYFGAKELPNISLLLSLICSNLLLLSSFNLLILKNQKNKSQTYLIVITTIQKSQKFCTIIQNIFCCKPKLETIKTAQIDERPEKPYKHPPTRPTTNIHTQAHTNPQRERERPTHRHRQERTHTRTQTHTHKDTYRHTNTHTRTHKLKTHMHTFTQECTQTHTDTHPKTQKHTK